MAASGYTGGSAGTLVELLKEQYTDETIAIMGYEDHPWYAMVDKDEDLGGEYFVEPIIYGHARRSHTFSTAQNQRSVSKHKQFQITTIDDYTIAEIDRKTKLMVRKGEVSFVDAQKRAIDEALYTITRGVGSKMYRSSVGEIGTLAGAPAMNVHTLSDPNDIVHFHVGMRFDVLDGADGASRGTQEITAVDRDAGTFTADGTAAGATTNDAVTWEGDRNLSLSGLADWIPDSAPSATLFFNVDRSVDTTWLGGVRMGLQGLPLEESLQKLATQVNRNGGRVDVILINDLRWTELDIALGDRVRRDTVKDSKALIGFDAIVLRHNKGTAMVVGDYNCPYNRAYALTKSTWTLRSILPVPHIFDLDTAQEMLRYGSSDGYELRVGYYAQLCCNAPGKNGVGKFDEAPA